MQRPTNPAPTTTTSIETGSGSDASNADIESGGSVRDQIVSRKRPSYQPIQTPIIVVIALRAGPRFMPGSAAILQQGCRFVCCRFLPVPAFSHPVVLMTSVRSKAWRPCPARAGGAGRCCWCSPPHQLPPVRPPCEPGIRLPRTMRQAQAANRGKALRGLHRRRRIALPPQVIVAMAGAPPRQARGSRCCQGRGQVRLTRLGTPHQERKGCWRTSARGVVQVGWPAAIADLEAACSATMQETALGGPGSSDCVHTDSPPA